MRSWIFLVALVGMAPPLFSFEIRFVAQTDHGAVEAEDFYIGPNYVALKLRSSRVGEWHHWDKRDIVRIRSVERGFSDQERYRQGRVVYRYIDEPDYTRHYIPAADPAANLNRREDPGSQRRLMENRILTLEQDLDRSQREVKKQSLELERARRSADEAIDELLYFKNRRLYSE